MIFAYSHIHVVVPVHSVKQGESIGKEVLAKVESVASSIGAVPIYALVLVSLLVVAGLIAYSVAGKGRGSHAGREEIRRAYRRRLAQEMAKEDAEKIKKGEKPRRRWMQW